MLMGKSRRQSWPVVGLVGLAMVAGAAFWEALTSPRVALAQIPDSGEQRNQMIAELRAANHKLDEVVRLLRDIRDAQVSEKKGKGAAGPGKP